MADVNPLKLVDLGSGQGQLREMQAGDKIPGDLLPATEWSAGTVTQTEAETGTATIRRAWTAQRVRQAILAWWNSVSSAWGRGFVASADAAAGRTALELGSAATANVQTFQTDTAAGRLMTVGAFGLGTPISLIGTDITSINIAGFFTCDVCTGTPPGYTSGILLSNGFGAAVRMQIFNPYGSDMLFFRSYLNGWNSWRELFHNGNILGPIYQSAGIPTGAIIERGSNVNGEYVRFADGTQICTTQMVIPAGSLNTRLAIEKAHPIGFSSISSVHYSARAQQGAGSQAAIGAIYTNGIYTFGTTTTVLSLHSYTYRLAVDEPVSFYVTTHGRWY